MAEIKIKKTKELKNFGYSNSAIELIDYCRELNNTDGFPNLKKKINLKYWVIAYHMWVNYIVRDREGLDTDDKQHPRGISNTVNCVDSMYREILCDFVLKMLEDDQQKKLYTFPYEYSHYWLKNDKVFKIMRAVAEYDFEKQINLFATIKQPMKHTKGFELYIKIGDWSLLDDESYGEECIFH